MSNFPPANNTVDVLSWHGNRFWGLVRVTSSRRHSKKGSRVTCKPYSWISATNEVMDEWPLASHCAWMTCSISPPTKLLPLSKIDTFVTAFGYYTSSQPLWNHHAIHPTVAVDGSLWFHLGKSSSDNTAKGPMVYYVPGGGGGGGGGFSENVANKSLTPPVNLASEKFPPLSAPSCGKFLATGSWRKTLTWWMLGGPEHSPPGKFL